MFFLAVNESDCSSGVDADRGLKPTGTVKLMETFQRNISVL